MVAAVRMSNVAATYHAVRRSATDQLRVANHELTGDRTGLRLLIEDIPYPAYRVNQLAVVRVIQLGAEPAHVHVHHVGIAVEVHVPDLLGDERAGEDLARAACQQR